MDKKRTRCEIWTRTMGYFRPVSNYNIGKKSEFVNRLFFKEKLALSNKQFMENNMNNPQYILATTTTCPKCPTIKKALMDKLWDNMKTIDENDDNFWDIIAEYWLTQAPSLIDIINKKVVNIDDILS